ncbi:MAG: FGGY family carbohydrate kinase, partial [Variovorax sp.]|uniref:FGGY family carbohydrate kinase n=1 Tax=Variovorax sp. TaxID=1871043 RepID=UPI004037907A
MQKYLLGLDAGNTVIKAVIFDLAGREVAHAGEEGHSRMPCPGHVERDLGELWANAKRVIRTCLDKAGIAASDIAAIGCAGHGNGLYLVDEDLRPVRTAIASTDSRAESVVAGLDGDTVDAVQRITGSLPWAAQPGVLLRWLHDNEPESIAAARWSLTCKDWLTTYLTGAPSAD